MVFSSSNDEGKRTVVDRSSCPPPTNIVDVEAAEGMTAGFGCSNEGCESLMDMGSIGDRIFLCLLYM